MKLCIVGNGPSAEGHGREIDACDFVVRIKAFWLRGAKDAGDKIDVWAWFGMTDPSVPDFVPAEDISRHIPKHAQHWFTDCMQHVTNCGYHGRLGDAELVAYTHTSHQMPLWQISDVIRNHAWRYLQSPPSTGFLAVCMALQLYPSCELVLFGFDSTTRDKLDFLDARGIPSTQEDPTLDLRAEKRAIAEILEGTWLGEPTAVTLVWPDMPKGL